jgi:hypothetical protein
MPAIVDLVREKLPDSYDVGEVEDKSDCSGAANWYGCREYSIDNVVAKGIKAALDIHAVGDFSIQTHDVRHPDGSVSATISMAAQVNDLFVSGRLKGKVRARAFTFGAPNLVTADGGFTTHLRGSAIILAEAKAFIDPISHCLSVSITSVEADIVKTSLQNKGNELEARLGMCQGECDSNSDCKNGYICHQRSGTTPVPGCFGEGREDWDYCTFPNLDTIPYPLDLYNYDVNLNLRTAFGRINVNVDFILQHVEGMLLAKQIKKHDIISDDDPKAIPGCLAKVDDAGLAEYAMLPPGMITDLSRCPAPTMLNDADGNDKLIAWEGQSGVCPSFPIDSCLGTTAASPLAQLRQSSLQCLASLNYPLVDNPNWHEFDEKCASFTTIDGTTMEVAMAEPRNALSNAAYDHLACRADSPGLHTSASLLGFGSFAFHAKGATEEQNQLTRKFDSVGMKCLTVSVFHAALVRTGTPTTLSIGSDTYDIAALKQEHCETALPNALRSCENEAAIAEAYDAANKALPDYKALISMLLVASTHHCYGGTAIGLTQQAISLMMSTDEAAALASFRYTSPRALTPRDYTDADAGFCRNINYFVSKFVCGIVVQGDMLVQLHPAFDQKEDHALWHSTSAEAVNHAAIAIESL